MIFGSGASPERAAEAGRVWLDRAAALAGRLTRALRNAQLAVSGVASAGADDAADRG